MQYYTTHNEHMVEGVMGPGGEFNIVVQLTQHLAAFQSITIVFIGKLYSQY